MCTCMCAAVLDNVTHVRMHPHTHTHTHAHAHAHAHAHTHTHTHTHTQGNLEFSEDKNEELEIADTSLLSTIASLLAAAPAGLEKALCYRVVGNKLGSVEKMHTREQAEYGRDAFAKVERGGEKEGHFDLETLSDVCLPPSLFSLPLFLPPFLPPSLSPSLSLPPSLRPFTSDSSHGLYSRSTSNWRSVALDEWTAQLSECSISMDLRYSIITGDNVHV